MPPERVGFILVPGFPLMSFACALEPLRAANHLADANLFDMSMYSDGGGPISSSCGVVIQTENLPSSRGDLAIALVVAGGHPAQWGSRRIDACLRQLVRFGVTIGGICAGPFFLARAGLLDGRRFTIHWEHIDIVREIFPSLTPELARFVRDNNRMTCGGGIAPLDLLHSIIAERYGTSFARQVSDWFLHTKVGLAVDPQRSTVAERHDAPNFAVAKAISLMEDNISEPLRRDVVAQSANVSSRHLERLFISHKRVSFSEIYIGMRLSHAKRLLSQSPLSVSEVAVASGFVSLSHFSRTFRKKCGKTPLEWRKLRVTKRQP